MEFDWDPDKAKSNLDKHGVSFDEAKTVFGDPLFLIFADPDHSIGEERFIIVGESSKSRLLIVAYAQHDEVFRLISARQATKKERRAYEQDL